MTNNFRYSSNTALFSIDKVELHTALVSDSSVDEPDVICVACSVVVGYFNFVLSTTKKKHTYAGAYVPWYSVTT